MRHLFQWLGSHHGLPWLFLLGQFGFDFDPLTGIIEGFFEAILNFLLAVIQFIWNVLVWVANALAGAIVQGANYFQGITNDIGKFFRNIWDQFFKVLLLKLLALYQRLRKWLHDVLQPILDWIKKFRAWFDKYFNQYVRPLLKVLRLIRQVLTIFRLLGFKWAARLDADIARVEQAITKVYTTIRAYINEVITWVQLIVDPLGILRRNPLFAALINSAKEMENIRLQATQRPLLASEQATADRNRSWFNPSSTKDNYTYFSQGQLPPDMEDARKQFINTKTDPGSPPND